VPATARPPRPSAPGLIAALAVCGALLVPLAPPADAQEGPIRLFPQELAPTGPAPDRRAATPPGAAPGPPPRGFQVEGLAPPEVDSIGLAGSFEPTLWTGSDPRLILSLLSQLPVAIRNPALQALTRRVLAAGAALEGATEDGRMLSARVGRLLAMGDLDSAKQLLDQLPPSVGDPALAQLSAEVALLAGDDAAACQRAADLAPTSGAAFWSEVAIYCRLAAGDADGARLGLELLRDAGQSADVAFVELAGMVADGAAGVALPPLPAPAAIHVALLRLAQQPLPEAALARAPAPLLTAVARDPALAGAQQLALAERAFASGGLAGSGLAAIYAERAPQGDALERLRSDWGPEARALALRAVIDQQTPQERVALLDATWRAAAGEERFLVAAAFAPYFAELPPDRALLPVAPSAARALLAGGRPLPAARWFALLSAAGDDGAAARERTALMPLFALAGIGGSDAVPRLDQRAVGAWRATRPDADAMAERLFALLDGVGSPVPDEAWWQQLAAPLERPASVPVSALWRGLERAAAGGRTGETVLFALHMLNGAPEAAHPAVLTAALQALRAVGLDREARDIAVASAIGADL
jgi:hypothetical protein